jgi:hypothetical protein
MKFSCWNVSHRPLTATTINGNLWDIATFDITSFLAMGNNNLNITLGPGFNDAIAAIAAVVNLPSGAAPVRSVPEPDTLALFGLSLVSLVLVRRKTIR